MATRPDIEVIAPNLSRRVSGVTASINAVLPHQTKLIGIVTTGNVSEPALPRVPLWKIPFMNRKRRVWHARRNNEMIVGWLLKRVFFCNLKLVFTSSSPRKRGGLTHFLLNRMDAIVATADQNARVMPYTTAIVPHGVDTNRFLPGQSDLFGIGHQRVIGCFGRVREMKGTHHFVNAMCEVLPDHPEWRAVIVGKVTQDHETFAQRLRDQIAAKGLSDRITFEEEVPLSRIPEAYQSLSLYVAPSLLEGYGLTPFEAMSSGVPTIATKVGAQGLAIGNSGAGHAVDPDDTAALTNACADMLENRNTLAEAGIAARKHVQTHFAIENEAAALVQVYRDLLNAK
jgi:mannosyltransferase